MPFHVLRLVLVMATRTVVRCQRLNEFVANRTNTFVPFRWLNTWTDTRRDVLRVQTDTRSTKHAGLHAVLYRLICAARQDLFRAFKVSLRPRTEAAFVFVGRFLSFCRVRRLDSRCETSRR